MRSVFCLVFCMLPLMAMSQSEEEAIRYYRAAYSSSWVQDKCFYILTLFQQVPDFSSSLLENNGLKEVVSEKVGKLSGYKSQYQVDPQVLIDLLKFSAKDMDRIGTAMQSLLEADSELAESLSWHLRSSGNYFLLNGETDQELVIKALAGALAGLNLIMEVYGQGASGPYPKIDSASFAVDNQKYQWSMEIGLDLLSDNWDEKILFFEPGLDFALKLLEMNRRDEAERFEPMHATVNQSAYFRIPDIRWEDYPYSCILVPGYGPEEAQLSNHPLGSLRCELVAKRYFAGQAPLIIVSGGYVHPFQTRFCEAREMKRLLMEKHGVPEHAILMDPHARHTTTNFRNAARLIFRYGIPMDKMALVTTDKYQSYYISDMELDKRCLRELGFVPYELHERLSMYDIEFTPQISSLQRDPSDALDP